MSSNSPSMTEHKNDDAEYKEEHSLRNRKTPRNSNSTKSVGNKQKSNPKGKQKKHQISLLKNLQRNSHSIRRNRRHGNDLSIEFLTYYDCLY